MEPGSQHGRPVLKQLAVVILLLSFVGLGLPDTSNAVEPRGSTGQAVAGSRVTAKNVKLRVRKVRIKGTKIAYAKVGRGVPLLLLNGTGSPMSEWDPALLAKLAKKRRVIVFDYPGLGLSGRAPARITFRSLAGWTAEFLKAIGVRKADVLGWSMGGFVAQELLRRHPNRIRRAVLAGTNPGGHLAKLGPRWAQKIDSDPNAGINGYLKTNYPRTTCARRAGKRAVNRINTAIRRGRFPDGRVPARTYRAMVRAEDQWLRSSVNIAGLRRVRVPVLVMTGKQDVVTPAINSRRLARPIPNASLRLFAGSGHSFLFQQPALVARHVLAFLTPRATPSRTKRIVRTRCSR